MTSIQRNQFHSVLDHAAQEMVKEIFSDKAHPRYVEDGEIGYLNQGVESGFLSFKGNLMYIKGRPSPYRFFTFNREYFSQFAVLTELVKRYGYPFENCALEFHFMDICTFKNGKPYIFTETKIRGTEKLIEELNDIYGQKISGMMSDSGRGNDSLRKAQYIWKDRPEYFWLVTPTKRWAFKIEYSETGFRLIPIDDVPKFTNY